MYTLRTTREFDASLRRCIRQGRDIEIFRETANILAEDGCLPPEYKPHMLDGCVCRLLGMPYGLTMTNTGTHTELFSHRRKATFK